MRFIKPVLISFVVTSAFAISMLVPSRTLVAVQAPAPDKFSQKETVDQKEKPGFGRFVSFKDDTLTLESNSGTLLVWNKIAENNNTVKFDAKANEYKPVEGTAAALKQVQAGTYVMVGNGRSYIRIGARKDVVVSSFVSFKDNRLVALGKNLPEEFLKRYGSTLPYNKFRDDVPVHESVDGGEYKLIGTANQVLGSVKEGTVLTIHGEGDDNITLIQIGVPKSK